MISMAAAVFFENLCGGMGTAAFVALLMTLCNKSFSATQFALLSALSAVGRVYVGPIAGWFVEAHGWPTFYLFSVVAAVPHFIVAGLPPDAGIYPANRTLYAANGISARLPFCATPVNGGMSGAGVMARGAYHQCHYPGCFLLKPFS